MLAGKRAVRVGDQILKEMALLFMNRVNDPRVKNATLTGIHLSDDLKNARVYYSVIGDNTEIRNTQAGLDSAKGFIKREISLRVNLKYMPDIVFKHDPTLEMGTQMEKLFDKIKSEESTEDRD